MDVTKWIYLLTCRAACLDCELFFSTAFAIASTIFRLPDWNFEPSYFFFLQEDLTCDAQEIGDIFSGVINEDFEKKKY